MAALLLAVVLLLFTRPVTRWVVEMALDRIEMDGARLTAGAIDGRLWTHLTLIDTRLGRPGAVALAEADTITVRYALVPLLWKQVHLRRVAVVGLQVSAAQDSSKAWDVFALFSADTTSSAFEVTIDDLALRDGRIDAATFAPERDSTYHIRDIDLALKQFHLGESLRFQLDTLRADILFPDTTHQVALRARAALREDVLTLAGLRITSPGSQVDGAGTLRLSTNARPLDEATLSLHARPIAFDDIRLFWPSLAPGGEATLDLLATSDSGTVRGELTADFPGGGRVEASVFARPYAGTPLLYRLHALLTEVDPGLFAGPDYQGAIDARLEIILEGVDVDSLDGEVHLDVPGARVGAIAMDSSALDVYFVRGAARIDLGAHLGAGRLVAAGTARPFDDAPSYDIVGRMDRIDIGRIGLLADVRSDLNGAFQVDGSGIDPATASATLGLQLEPSTLNDSRSSTGEARLSLMDGRLNFETALQAGAGRLNARGLLGLEAPYTLRVEEGLFDGIDVAALVGDTTRNLVRGTFTAEAEGNTIEDLELAARLTLEDSYYGRYHVNDGSIELTMQRGQATFALAGDLRGGTLQLVGAGRPFDPEPTFTVDFGRFDGVDLGVLLGNPEVSTALNATIEGQGTGGENPDIEARIVFGSSRVNGQSVLGATATAVYAGDSLFVELDIALPEGENRLAGWMHQRDEVWVYEIDGERIDGIDVGAWLGREEWETDLNGAFAAAGRGFDPATMALDATLSLASSEVNGASIEEVALAGRLRNGDGEATARIRSGDGTAEVDARVRGLGVQPTYAVEGAFEAFDMARLMGLDTLASHVTGSFQAEGTARRGAGALQLAGSVELDAGLLYGVAIEGGHTRFLIDRGVAHIDTVWLATDVFALAGAGAVALDARPGRRAAELDVSGQLRDLAPLRRFLDVDALSVQGGEVEARLFSRPNDYRLESNLELTGLTYGSTRIADARARWIAGLATDRTLVNSEVFGQIDIVSLPGFVVERVQFDGSFEDERLPFALEAYMDERRQARVSGTAYTAADSQRVDLEDLRIVLDGDVWTLDRVATVSYGGQYRVRNFLLESDDQQIAVDGVVDLAGDQNLGVSIDAFRLEAVTEMLGYEGLSGRLTGNLDLRGPAAAPRLISSLNLVIGSRGEPVGDLGLVARYDSLQLQLDVLMKHIDGSTLSINGFLPANLALAADSVEAMTVRSSMAEGPVEINAQADSFAIGWILPFVDKELMDRLEGTLTTRLQVDGTAAAPRLQGEGRLRLSDMRAPFLGVRYDGLSLDVSTRDNIVYIDDAHALTGSGRVDAAGVLVMTSLTEGAFDVDITAREFLAVDAAAYRAVASATARLEGTLANPALSGDLLLRSGDIYLDAWTSEEDSDVDFTPADVLMLERTFGVRVTGKDTTSFDLYEAMSMDLDVRMDRDIWLRSRLNPEMTIQFTGSLDLMKEPYQEATVFGAIEVVPERSYIKEFGKRFAIQMGTLSFNGSATEPVMAIQAQYEVPTQRSQENAVIINLDAEGRFDELNLTLSSEPAMELTDIVSYIATGQPASEALQLGGASNNTFASAGRGFAVSQGMGLLTGAIENLVSRSGLELDVIQIETSPSGRGATVTAGKYVTPRVYTSVSQPIGGAANGGATQEVGTVVTLELQLVNALLLRLLGGESSIQINLLWQHAY
ncbi:MAG: translocation/assembly module TamB domain-containing protein [Rhodothermales bacterium]|nr:translocation/assembly module TamB domain-containing protein [Rhodothermales bacterium]